MSFILDALRRAETQRGNQARTVAPDSALQDIADKPSAKLTPRRIAMLFVGAIAVAILALNFFDTRNLTQSVNPESDARLATQTQAQTAPFPTIAPDTPLAEVVTPATREVRPLLREAQPSRNESRAATTTENTPTRITPGTVSYSKGRLSAAEAGTRTLTNVPDDAPGSQESLPSYADTVLSGGAQMPRFHLDIHVYAAEPDRRFVFVNNRKYREGEQLDEGGTVERITPGGVVLNHRGRRFELVPD